MACYGPCNQGRCACPHPELCEQMTALEAADWWGVLLGVVRGVVVLALLGGALWGLYRLAAAVSGALA
jgi:hypothetical protein